MWLTTSAPFISITILAVSFLIIVRGLCRSYQALTGLVAWKLHQTDHLSR